MNKLSKEDLNDFVSELTSTDPEIRGRVVAFMAQRAVADSRLIPYLEKLLDDRSYIQLSIPYSYGEIRYAAAYALARIYKAMGMNKTIELKKVPVPLPGIGGFLKVSVVPDTHKYLLTKTDYRERHLQEYEILRDLGYVPLLDITITPEDTIQYDLEKGGGLPPGWKWLEE